ncbi:MAG: serine/threonine-protein kinase, partial [Rhodoglobus sp.]|nr:serine/threonine-protein kinase [Rhodoglobus sp.]
MARRLPSPPPILPGFSHVHILGSGGFADVFLYEQNMPRRQVAVKVMLSEVVNDQVRQMFQAEANLMAQLSAHPSILTVYQASVSSDGRPYLVMELCSSALSQRYRSERIPVPEVLRIAVKIGSAIETAHRAGVLHRDIKPSNILLTAYGHPVLSDFGIAASLSETADREAVGMSIPWSAPEVLMDETAGTIPSEVWAFAATVYSLLAGRSPFEVPGQSNTSTDLISRINRAKPQPMDRSDVPVRLELEDKTIIRGGAIPRGTVSQRRRRRRGLEQAYNSVGTIVKEDPVGSRTTPTHPRGAGRGMRALAWAVVAGAVFVVALGVLAILVLVRTTS